MPRDDDRRRYATPPPEDRKPKERPVTRTLTVFVLVAVAAVLAWWLL